MSSFFDDLKLLHPYFKLPVESNSSTWKERLVDPSVSLAEWSEHAVVFLKDVGGRDYRCLLATTAPETGCFAQIVEDALKATTEDFITYADKAYINHMSHWLPWWQEISLWSKETRYLQYSRFLDFVATVCSWFVPRQVQKHWNVLACAALIEVHYFVRLLDHLSRMNKDQEQSDVNGINKRLKCALDDACDIYLRCDPALYTLNKYDADWQICCRTFKNLLHSAIYNTARRSAIIPKHMYLKGVKKIGQTPVGGGGFADVWKGIMNGNIVALKVPRLYCTGINSKLVEAQICREGIVWNRLHHPNILPLLGTWHDSTVPFALVSPWMENGDLTSYLRRYPHTDRKEILHGVHNGLRYLHSQKPPVVHGDLRCSNILVDISGAPLIADFGLSRVQELQHSLQSASGNSSSGCGSLRWQAPEVCFPELFSGTGKHTTKSDVYAFAMTCLEVYSGKIPFNNDSNLQVVNKLSRGQMPDIPGNIKSANSQLAKVRERWWRTIRGCTAREADRPDIKGSVGCIDHFHDLYYYSLHYDYGTRMTKCLSLSIMTIAILLSASGFANRNTPKRLWQMLPLIRKANRSNSSLLQKKITREPRMLCRFCESSLIAWGHVRAVLIAMVSMHAQCIWYGMTRK